MTEHPLPRRRRLELGIARSLSRAIGTGPAGKLWTLMTRLRVAPSDLKTYYVLSTSPLIIYLGNVMRHVFEIAELLQDVPVCFVKNAYYTYEKPQRIAELREQSELFRVTYPQHRIHFLCATERECEMFHAADIVPATFMNKNAFVDEEMYCIDHSVQKEFDAIYNAQVWPGKRHELAKEIPRLGLLGYFDKRIEAEIGNYGERIEQILGRATWLNPGQLVAPRNVYKLLNRAHVGLCLSAEEGPMAASIEYMLCGLTVLSTKSLGGRDVFFDPEYVKIVDDDPVAVAEGVAELVSRRIPPEHIRAQTLKKMAVHRNRFIGIVEGIQRDSGNEDGFLEEFERIRVNKLRASAPFPGAFLQHIARGMPVDFCRTIAKGQVS